MTTRLDAQAALARTGLAPRGLSREQAAAYVGVSANKFDAMVGDGRMPRPRLADGRRIWCVREIDAAFSALPVEGDAEKAARDQNDVWGRMRL